MEQSRKKNVVVMVALVILMAILLSFSAWYGLNDSVPAQASTTTDADDVQRLAEALNVTTHSDTYSMGTESYKVFDVGNEDFIKLFNVVTDTYSYSPSFSARSLAEMSNKYSATYGVDFSAGVSIGGIPKVPVGISADVGTYFDLNYQSELDYIADEYYELYSTYKYSKIASIDWTDDQLDLDNFFSTAFKNKLSSVTDLASAIDLLEKYGTHVFGKYYFGGVLFMSSYICTEMTIETAYADMSQGYQISGKIDVAKQSASAGTSSTSGSIASTMKNDTQTKSTQLVTNVGGNGFGVRDIDGAFTWSEYAIANGGNKNGYMYSEWMLSLEADNPDDKIIKVENPVAIWELIKRSSLRDDAKIALLEKAFDYLSYKEYYNNCLELGTQNGLFNTISYLSNGYTVSLTPTDNKIKLPQNTEVAFVIGTSITDYFGDSDFAMVVKNANQDARFENGKLIIGDVQSGTKLNLEAKLFNNTIGQFEVTVESGKLSGGYGTKDQPYLIASDKDFSSLSTNLDYITGEKYFTIVQDIDLKGKVWNASTAEFNGVLDGNNHQVMNATIISKASNNNIGFFSKNSGRIQNISLKNIKCLNDKIITASTNGTINAGIVVGENTGLLSNIKIDSCAIRLSAKLDDTSSLNVGLLCGLDFGSEEIITVQNSYAFGQTYEGKGSLNVGNVIGNKKSGAAENINSRKNNCNARKVQGSTAQYLLGGMMGNITGDVTCKYCVSADNTYGQSDNNVGAIAGITGSKVVFNGCYYNAKEAVAGKAKDGCNAESVLSLENIGNADFEDYWTSDTTGLVLKAHRE